MATSLVYEEGLTLRSACGVLENLFGLKLSPGGLSQLARRAAEGLEQEEADLQEAAREANVQHVDDVQHVDETSWHVAAAQAERQPHWLWVFTGEDQTIYRVDHRRNREVVQELLGADFEGVLVSDCLSIYDKWAGPQQKCYAHHLKAISVAQAEEEALRGEPSAYLQEARAPLTEPEESVRNRLWKQREHLFTFLDHEGVEATNNLAERRLRPAVIRLGALLRKPNRAGSAHVGDSGESGGDVCRARAFVREAGHGSRLIRV